MKTLLALMLIVFAHPGMARPAALDAYKQELARVEQAGAPVSLEPLFAAADAVQAAVMQLDGGQAWLETLGEADYAALGRELRGFQLNRGFDIYAQPLPEFFLALAVAHGRAQDIEFFQLYRQYWSVDFMPVFQRQGHAPTPCVRYGEGVLAEVYEAFGIYARRYPNSYMGFAEQTIVDVEEMLTLGTCACGDLASVNAELKNFLRRFPQTPAAPGIRARLRQLREDPDKLPIRCR